MKSLESEVGHRCWTLRLGAEVGHWLDAKVGQYRLDTEVGRRSWMQRLDAEVGRRVWTQMLDAKDGRIGLAQRLDDRGWTQWLGA